MRDHFQHATYRKKRWIYWSKKLVVESVADGHLTLFCYPLLLDISMSKSSMFITIKSWSARVQMQLREHASAFCFFRQHEFKGWKKQLQIDVGWLFYIQIRLLFVSQLPLVSYLTIVSFVPRSSRIKFLLNVVFLNKKIQLLSDI